MRRDELADYAEQTIRTARDRFTGVGADRYQISENEQSFERESIGTLLTGLREELIDQINYIVMLDIRIQQTLAALGALGWDVPQPGEDYVAAVNRNAAEPGWEAKRD
jgi:hypothetical protein